MNIKLKIFFGTMLLFAMTMVLTVLFLLAEDLAKQEDRIGKFKLENCEYIIIVADGQTAICHSGTCRNKHGEN